MKTGFETASPVRTNSTPARMINAVRIKGLFVVITIDSLFSDLEKILSFAGIY